MLDVLAWDEGEDERWRLLILEDAGELIAGILARARPPREPTHVTR